MCYLDLLDLLFGFAVASFRLVLIIMCAACGCLWWLILVWVVCWVRWVSGLRVALSVDLRCFVCCFWMVCCLVVRYSSGLLWCL